MTNSGLKYRRKSASLCPIIPSCNPEYGAVDDRNGAAHAASPVFCTGANGDPVKSQSLRSHNGDSKIATIRPIPFRKGFDGIWFGAKSAKARRNVELSPNANRSIPELANVAEV